MGVCCPFRRRLAALFVLQRLTFFLLFRNTAVFNSWNRNPFYHETLPDGRPNATPHNFVIKENFLISNVRCLLCRRLATLFVLQRLTPFLIFRNTAVRFRLRCGQWCGQCLLPIAVTAVLAFSR